MSGKPSTRRPALTLFELLAVVLVAVLLFTFVLPQLMPRRRGTWHRCRNNLRQILLALHNYSDHYGSLPPAYTVDAKGKPLHSWRTLILPYVDQAPLYQKIDFSKPWDHPANAVAFNTAIPFYQCPSNRGLPPNHTTYLAVSSPNACFHADKPRKLSEITDGLVFTLIVIEVPLDKSIPWMAPIDADEKLIIGIRPTSKLPHTDGVNAAIADGRVAHFNAKMPTPHRKARMTISGGEQILGDDF